MPQCASHQRTKTNELGIACCRSTKRGGWACTIPSRTYLVRGLFENGMHQARSALTPYVIRQGFGLERGLGQACGEPQLWNFYCGTSIGELLESWTAKRVSLKGYYVAVAPNIASHCGYEQRQPLASHIAFRSKRLHPKGSSQWPTELLLLHACPKAPLPSE